MDITLIEAAEGVWYAPDIGDNRELAEEAQMRALIVPMSGHEMQRLEEQCLRLTRGSKLNLGKRLNRVKAAIVSRCVKRFANLRVNDERQKPATVREIRDGAELVGFAGYAPIDAIVEDLCEAIKDHSMLEEGMAKKSVPPSVS